MYFNATIDHKTNCINWRHFSRVSTLNPKQEIVFKKEKATLHVISKRCEETVNYSN